jgi:gamma-glutamyltranspeptidase / glutathione hydrolase
MSQSGVVAADHPLASAVGAQILSQGGSAADAGVATILTLGVVNPFASGLGGGGFCVYRAPDGQTMALDFREVAPQAARPDMFAKLKKANPRASTQGGLAVAVPGEAAGLWALHKRFGALPWAQAVDPAHQIAWRGFHVGTLLPERIANKADDLKRFPALEAALRHEDGSALKRGDWFTRPALADTLARLRDEGPDAFYTGPIASAIVRATKAAGGQLTAKDLATYKVTERAPLIGSYRGYTLITMPPPSSGGVALLEMLKILEGWDLRAIGRTPRAMHLIAEAMKHAFADRSRWLGDPDRVKVPTALLTSEAYAASLRAKIDEGKTRPPQDYGTVGPLPKDGGTSHISIVDAQGGMLSCTSTVNTSFGSLVYVPEAGIVLNNEMDDFSTPGTPNAFGLLGNAQNAPDAGKRPLSSMSPTLVLQGDAPAMIAGASGGPTIITGVLMALIATLDWEERPDQAVLAGRVHHQWMPNRAFVEDAEVGAALEQRGHEIKVGPAFSSVQIIVKKGGAWVGVSDPRKNGRPAAASAQAARRP